MNRFLVLLLALMLPLCALAEDVRVCGTTSADCTEVLFTVDGVIYSEVIRCEDLRTYKYWELDVTPIDAPMTIECYNAEGELRLHPWAVTPAQLRSGKALFWAADMFAGYAAQPLVNEYMTLQGYPDPFALHSHSFNVRDVASMTVIFREGEFYFCIADFGTEMYVGGYASDQELQVALASRVPAMSWHPVSASVRDGAKAYSGPGELFVEMPGVSLDGNVSVLFEQDQWAFVECTDKVRAWIRSEYLAAPAE